MKHNRKAKFGLVGFLNTLIGYGAFASLETLFSLIFPARYIAYMAAIVLANVIAILNAYIFHRYVTFKSRTKGKAFVSEFCRFCATYLFAFLLNLFVLPFFVEILNIRPKLAGALAIPVCIIVSYIGHSRFSFKDVEIQ